MRAEVLRLADRAGARMRAQNLATGCVQVKIRRADFTTFTRQKRFEPSTTDSRTIAKIAAELLTALARGTAARKVRLLGVGVNHLHAADQLDLFAQRPAASPEPRLRDGARHRRRPDPRAFREPGRTARQRAARGTRSRGSPAENMSEEAPGKCAGVASSVADSPERR